MSSVPARALVFDIRRFSTHDGRGIRTNIFFKGCPMRCVWCQNPEGLLPGPQPVWFSNLCIGCGTCIQTSRKGGVTLSQKAMCDNNVHAEYTIIPHGNMEDCWDDILDACPTGALRMDSRYYTLDQLLTEIEKDRVFMDMGGGVTLSGGEPLLQYHFAAELLKNLKSRGIHTAMETALDVASEALTAVYPYLDQLYADLKIYDNDKHKKYTGADNRQILKNLHFILTGEHRDRVIIRTPLIPQMTATEENIRQIAEFISGLYPDVRYELLNYNPLAQAKYPMAGREYCFKENPKRYTEQEMQKFRKIAEDAGVKHIL